ncbi:hypothetical protein HYY74_00105 [Candidatus Woesearchaeota archaeon]|nr:hypothetical protein [Candidatus Woesearchaeota archaeon]
MAVVKQVKRQASAALAFAILLALSTAAMAADPGHPASSIGAGIVGDIIGGKCDASL